MDVSVIHHRGVAVAQKVGEPLTKGVDRLSSLLVAWVAVAHRARGTLTRYNYAAK